MTSTVARIVVGTLGDLDGCQIWEAVPAEGRREKKDDVAPKIHSATKRVKCK